MGRKPFGRLFEALILSCLDKSFPKTVEAVRREAARKLNRPGLSWHTVRKYLEFLRDSGMVEEIRAGKILTYRLRKR